MAAKYKGRATGGNTPNRFERLHFEPLEEAADEEAPHTVPTSYYMDSSRSILARNDSPDIPFTFSINPYRGCEHGCIYCYARPSHEYLGFSAGLDFETKILVKPDAPALLEQAFRRRSWNPQTIALSGNTDCYQPVEKRLGLTRRCLEIFLNYRNPVSIVTKNALLLRDLDLLEKLAELDLVHVMMSITSLDPELIRVMEPRTSIPALRLGSLRELSSHGIPVGVNVAPIIPGLTDEEIPAILEAAAGHGATTACFMLVRFPGAVQQLFLDWLKRELPQRAGKILNRIRETREGKLSDARFGTRVTGEGEFAGTLNELFRIHAEKLGLTRSWRELAVHHFRRVAPAQGELFG
jgi:DNA repair photolyase